MRGSLFRARFWVERSRIVNVMCRGFGSVSVVEGGLSDGGVR